MKPLKELIYQSNLCGGTICSTCLRRTHSIIYVISICHCGLAVLEALFFLEGFQSLSTSLSKALSCLALSASVFILHPKKRQFLTFYLRSLVPRRRSFILFNSPVSYKM